MRRIISLMTAGLFLVILFTSCTKEYSVENGLLPGSGGTTGGTQTGTAQYTWTGAPNACGAFVVNGDYIVGTALTAANTVILEVDVTLIGTYTVSTGTGNGITFSGTGTFTTTGTQVLVLTGTGTPTAAGTNSYSPGTAGCTFQVTTTTTPPAPVAAGTLDCATATILGTYTQSIPLTGTNTVSIPVNVTTAGTYSISTTANGVSFSGSGTLALGAQTIVLTGNGTANNAGATSFPINIGTNSCSFSITFLPAPPPAVGVFDCTSIVVAGTYTQHELMTTSNTISININVTTAGLYLINTGAVNGVTFSGSGVLALGNQTIVLTAVGNPQSAGAFSYPITFTSSGSNCSTSITFGASLTDFFKVKIDGVLTTFNVNLLGDPSPLFSGLFTIAVSGDAAAGSNESLDFTVNNFSAVDAGTYLHPLGLRFSTSHYIDAAGDGWQPADASSPAFSVVVTSVAGNRITGTFSGQYKSQNGTGTGSKIFTEGVFSVPY